LKIIYLAYNEDFNSPLKKNKQKKIFLYVDLMLKKHLLLIIVLSILKIVVQLNIFVETMKNVLFDE